jgi:dCMP deaminase
MEMARMVSAWSSCIRPGRAIGAVIVKDKRVMTTGYNGAASGTTTCKDRGWCLRDKLNIPSGTRQEVCYAIHAEQNAVIQAAKLGLSIDSATLYCTHQPCSVCARILVNAGIRRIVYEQGYPDGFALEVLGEAGVSLERYEADK